MPVVSSTPFTPSLTRLTVPVPLAEGKGRAVAVAAVTTTAPATQGAQAASPAMPGVQQSLVEAAKSTSRPSSDTVSKEELTRRVHEMQAKMDKLNPALSFVVDEDSGRTLIQLTDRATKEVILQFPTQVALQISKALDRFQKGQLVNRTV